MKQATKRYLHKHSRLLFTLLILISSIFLYAHQDTVQKSLSFIDDVGQQLASALVSHKPKLVSEIKANYDQNRAPSQKKVRILLAPGHEPGYGGAEYRTLREREMAVELAKNIQTYLQNNTHYQVFVTRNNDAWEPTFAEYFKNNWQDIIAWQHASRKENHHLISIGAIKKSTPKVFHNKTDPDIAMRLYGINKWANDNDIDITIHIHFNDETEHRYNMPGNHSGFAIYVPDSQFDNSTTTRMVANSIFKRLAQTVNISTLRGETEGIVSDQQLIAVGSNNTANSASMLIEYGYIYEPQFSTTQLRASALQNLALQTYLGLQDFFETPLSLIK